MHRTDTDNRSSIVAMKTVTALGFVLSALVAPGHAFATEGCCEKLVAGKKACSDPSCVSACFTMPTVESCKSLDQSYYWNNGRCWGLPECQGKPASGCCVGETKCYAGFSSAQCSAVGVGSSYSEKGCGADENRVKCSGKLEDPSLESTVAVPGEPGTDTGVTPPKPKFVIPALAIKLPGLPDFAEPGGDETSYVIPYIGQYISAVYGWATLLVSILATTMIVWGGVKWLTAGGDSSKVSGAKTTITNALVGLLLAFGTYLILWTLNPDIVNFKALRISVVQREDMSSATAPMNDAVGNATKANEKEIYEGAKMAGADPCAILAFCEHETGLRMIWNGWPRNPKENSFSWGPCSGDGKFFKDGSRNDQKMRAAFPNVWPPLGTDLQVPAGKKVPLYGLMQTKADLIMSNPRVAGYLAGIEVTAPTFDATANAGIGGGNIKRWREANGCAGTAKNITFAAAVTDVDTAIMQACLPVAAAGGAGCPQDKQNCSPIDLEKYPKTKGYEISPSGVIHGICASTGAQCFTIWTIDHIRYAVQSYARFDSKYHCSASTK